MLQIFSLILKRKLDSEMVTDSKSTNKTEASKFLSLV